MSPTLSEVFGVSRHSILSYVERPSVDEAFTDALKGTRQIVIYGSSKQGKTALLDRHVAGSNRTTVHCGPTMSAGDLYRSILRQNKIEIVTESNTDTGQEATASAAARFKAILPWVASSDLESRVQGTVSENNSEKRAQVEFNLDLAQDVAELLLQINHQNHLYVLENFHYVQDDVQNQLAFDLRTFEEMGIRFIILGVWRERNRLIQYNGDLQDRLAEVPVEPWLESDFERVVQAGSQHLNILIDGSIQAEIFRQAHGSIAVVQELLKLACEQSGVVERQEETALLNERNYLKQAVIIKVQEYLTRHVRSLETIAAGSRTRRETEATAALYLPYYFVDIMVRRNFDELKDGIERKTLTEWIRKIHPKPDNVRGSDITGMLSRLSALQARASIVPPLFDYDRGSRRVKIVDSTLYFFIDNCDPDDVMDEIASPEDQTV